MALAASLVTDGKVWVMQSSSGADPQDRLAYLVEKKHLVYGAREALQVVFQALAGELYRAIGHKWPDAAD